MPFNQLESKQDGLYITERVQFNGTIALQPYVDQVFEFAYGMTFGREGHHRKHRTGGQYGRKNGELFINTFQGKLAEFGMCKALNDIGVSVSEPDLSMWGEAEWDNEDLTAGTAKINIKSTSYKGNLLLLETKDWNKEGHYIPNLQKGSGRSDYFVLCRLAPDGKSLMKSKRWMYANQLEEGVLSGLILKEKWSMDVCGYLTLEDIKHIIQHEYIIPQNAMLNGWMPMDAENYYVQAGDFRDIKELTGILT